MKVFSIFSRLKHFWGCNYKKICYNITDTLDRNDRDDFFSNFILWFSNMKSYDDIKENKEPITGEHFLCFKCVYHRGEIDIFIF